MKRQYDRHLIKDTYDLYGDLMKESILKKWKNSKKTRKEVDLDEDDLMTATPHNGDGVHAGHIRTLDEDDNGGQTVRLMFSKWCGPYFYEEGLEGNPKFEHLCELRNVIVDDYADFCQKGQCPDFQDLIRQLVQAAESNGFNVIKDPALANNANESKRYAPNTVGALIKLLKENCNMDDNLLPRIGKSECFIFDVRSSKGHAVLDFAKGRAIDPTQI